ncbi:hypothetical protein K431DRAFT_68370 [Polychaeton citri CBS 116435]|uniref:Uncharacterized protein n=1 Tax=Polychaeton citri CBS 116435 TaxID=1314669 RepID=A0A9P4UP90_9PEZI|nr:hypothetical protein K431DRAFT_68370 [Polychaeton citri CBS 116435]
MMSYFLWLVFQLKTHRQMFNEPVQKHNPEQKSKSKRMSKGQAAKALAKIGARTGATTGFQVNKKNLVPEAIDGEEDLLVLSLTISLVLIAVATTLLAFNTELATNSIQALLVDHGVTTSFLGMVVLPLLNKDP